MMLEICDDVNLQRINVLLLKMRSHLSFPLGVTLNALQIPQGGRISQ